MAPCAAPDGLMNLQIRIWNQDIETRRNTQLTKMLTCAFIVCIRLKHVSS